MIATQTTNVVIFAILGRQMALTLYGYKTLIILSTVIATIIQFEVDNEHYSKYIDNLHIEFPMSSYHLKSNKYAADSGSTLIISFTISDIAKSVK